MKKILRAVVRLIILIVLIGFSINHSLLVLLPVLLIFDGLLDETPKSQPVKLTKITVSRAIVRLIGLLSFMFVLGNPIFLITLIFSIVLDYFWLRIS